MPICEPVMFPYIRVPSHITALYIFEIINFIVFFHVALVQGDVLVTSTRTNRTFREIADFPASFGPPIPDEGIKGFLVYANPAEACGEILPPPSSPGHVNWIVLIRRFGCNFDQKVLSAQRAGFSAAIVHNVNSNNIEPMGPDEGVYANHQLFKFRREGWLDFIGQGINIPSVFIGSDDGMEIHDRYTYEKGFIITITPDLPDFYNLDLQKYILPFVCVLGVCFITTIVTLIYKCVRDQRRRRRHRLSPKHLKKLPVRKFKKGDQYDTCAICLEEYIENEKLRELPCNHVYHTKCIDPWLTRNRRTCPVCKRKVFPAGTVTNESDEDSDEEAGRTSETTPLLRSAASLPTNGSTFSHTPQATAPSSHFLLFSTEAVTAHHEPDILIPGTSRPAVESHFVNLSSDGSVNGSTSDYVPAAEIGLPATEMDTSPNRERTTPVEIGVDVVTQQRSNEDVDHRGGARNSDLVV